jgi:multidrug efflux system membrane fusion protein
MAVPRRLRWGFALLGLLLIALVLWAVVGRRPRPKAMRPPAVAVSVAKVAVQDVPISISVLGAAQAWQGVLIRAQVNGVLKNVAVREGSDVKAGELLAEIDCTPYRATLLQTQGALERDRALLEEARVDLARYQTLVAQDSIGTQQRDVQAALVKQDEGTVHVDEGSVAAAQVNVGYCRITSPVTGRVGVRMVDPGNLVSTTDTTGIIIVNQISPIAVTFTVPQGDFQRLSDVSNGFTRPLTTEALSQDTGAMLGTGELSIADNRVDQTTGTVTMKARFPNASKRLWPGQFVNVRLVLQTLPRVTAIPVTAVNQGPKGPFAYVVDADSKVAMRPITVLATQDAVAVIQAGLSPGETVVTDGQISLRPGVTVATRQPSASKKPAA